MNVVTSQQPILRVAGRQAMPWTLLSRGEDDGNLTIGGPTGNILEAISNVLEFQFELVQPDDNLFGAPLPNGSWNGMIGMVHRGDVELSLGPFSISPERASVVDFSTPVHHSSNAILTTRPTLENDVKGIVKPFSLEVWILILCSLAAISFLLAIIENIERKLDFGSLPIDVTSKSVMLSVKVMAQESSEWLPEKDGGRLLAGTWLLASLVFMSCYGGILTAMLTVPKITISINSLEDLVSQSEIPWKLLPGTFLTNYLKESEDAVHQMAYNGASGRFQSCWRNKEEITKGDYAAICPVFSIKKVISWDFSTTGKCHTYMARKYVYENNMFSLAFREKSPYLEKSNKVINNLKEGGLIDYWLNQQLTNITQCMKPPSADRSAEDKGALDIEALGGSFLVLVAGYLLSAMFFFEECTRFYIIGTY